MMLPLPLPVSRYRARYPWEWITPLFWWILTIVGITLVALAGVHYLGLIWAQRTADEHVCAARVEVLVTRNPVLRKMVRPPRPCEALAVLVPEGRR